MYVTFVVCHDKRAVLILGSVVPADHFMKNYKQPADLKDSLLIRYKPVQCEARPVTKQHAWWHHKQQGMRNGPG